MIAHDRKPSWLSKSLRSVLIAGLAVSALALTPAAAGQERGGDRDREHVMELLERIEIGMSALAELGRHELVQELRRVAGELRETIDSRERRDRVRADERERGRNREREMAERQLEVLRLALTALREADRGDAAELVHRAIRAREVGLEGRRDEEARAIRERQPNRDQLRELVAFAAELWADFGRETRAAELGRAVDELWPRRGRQRERREARGENREWMTHVLEVMELAKVALLEGGRPDSAELMERAMQAQRVRLRGLEGNEARMVLEREPQLGARVELLNFAAELWREFGDPEKAEMLTDVARRLWSEREERERGARERGERERDERREGEHGDRERAVRMDELRDHLGELQRAMEELRGELDRLRRDG